MAFFPQPVAPLIAGGFDALNAQRFGWTNRNDQIEQANLARAAAAQEAQNRWLANAAAMQQAAQQRNVELQLSQDATMRQEAWRQRQAEDESKRWAEDIAWRKQSEAARLGEERYRSEVMSERAALADKLARDQMVFDIDQTGQNAAQQLAGLKRQYEKAQADVTALEDEQSRLEKQQTDFDAKSKTSWFGLRGGLSEPEKQLQTETQTRLMELKKLLAPRSEVVKLRDRAENAYDKYREQFLGTDFSVDDDTNTIRHRSGKVWSFGQAVQEARASNPNPFMWAASIPLAATADALASAPRFAAFNTPAFRGAGAGASWEPAATTGTGTNPAPLRVVSIRKAGQPAAPTQTVNFIETPRPAMQPVNVGGYTLTLK